MGRYSFMVWITAAVIGLGVLAWRMSAFAEVAQSLPEEPPALLQQGQDSPIGLADQAAALAQLQRASSIAEVYMAENGTYAGLTAAALRSLDPSVEPTVVVARSTATGYCIQVISGSVTVHATGPDGPRNGPCP